MVLPVIGRRPTKAGNEGETKMKAKTIPQLLKVASGFPEPLLSIRLLGALYRSL
jgi:hypothetical protein